MFNGSRTIYSKKLANRAKCGLPYVPLLNTTLNERFNIESLVDNKSVTYPTINLLTFGIGASDTSVKNTRLDLKSSTHSYTDAALFTHIPLYMRKESEITLHPPSSKLRLRTSITFDNEKYIVYYGYKIDDFDSNDDVVTFNNIEEEYVNISKLDVSSLSVLYPEPKNVIDLKTCTKQYIGDFIKVYTFITEEELLEIENVFNLLYPNKEQIITEVGICHSKEMKYETYIENVQVQISYFLDTKFDIKQSIKEEKLDFIIELGDMELMIL